MAQGIDPRDTFIHGWCINDKRQNRLIGGVVFAPGRDPNARWFPQNGPAAGGRHAVVMAHDDDHRGHIPSVRAVNDAIARSAAQVLQQAQGQLIPEVMAEVRQISDELRAANEALTERVRQQEVTIAVLQEQLEETNRQLADVLARLDPQGGGQ